ncbi:MAG: hypothetical protein KY475_11870 [Planctomycetes bacterium]|nr:hypothetical protein [Planctomycetota bacterium]
MAATPRRSSASSTATAKRGRKKSPKKGKQQPKLDRLRKPEEMSIEAWQRELRRQFGPEQPKQLTNQAGNARRSERVFRPIPFPVRPNVVRHVR